MQCYRRYDGKDNEPCGGETSPWCSGEYQVVQSGCSGCRACYKSSSLPVGKWILVSVGIDLLVTGGKLLCGGGVGGDVVTRKSILVCNIGSSHNITSFTTTSKKFPPCDKKKNYPSQEQCIWTKAKHPYLLLVPFLRKRNQTIKPLHQIFFSRSWKRHIVPPLEESLVAEHGGLLVPSVN